MASYPTSSTPVARDKRANGKTRPVGAFFKAAAARGLVGSFSGPADLAENHSRYLKAKLRARAKGSR